MTLRSGAFDSSSSGTCSLLHHRHVIAKGRWRGLGESLHKGCEGSVHFILHSHGEKGGCRKYSGTPWSVSATADRLASDNKRRPRAGRRNVLYLIIPRIITPIERPESARRKKGSTGPGATWDRGGSNR